MFSTGLSRNPMLFVFNNWHFKVIWLSPDILHSGFSARPRRTSLQPRLSPATGPAPPGPRPGLWALQTPSWPGSECELAHQLPPAPWHRRPTRFGSGPYLLSASPHTPPLQRHTEADRCVNTNTIQIINFYIVYSECVGACVVRFWWRKKSPERVDEKKKKKKGNWPHGWENNINEENKRSWV